MFKANTMAVGVTKQIMVVKTKKKIVVRFISTRKPAFPQHPIGWELTRYRK